MQTYKSKIRPDEKAIAQWSFDSRMAPTETVMTRTATSAGFTITAVGADDDSRGVSCLVDNGVDTTNPVIKYGVTTSLGQELFEEVILRVRADPYGTD